jgi:hypothetical protein
MHSVENMLPRKSFVNKIKKTEKLTDGTSFMSTYMNSGSVKILELPFSV